jgi:hypothetical protein
VSWSRNGDWILTERGSSIRVIHVPTKKFSDVLEKSPLQLWQPRLSPDERAVAFVMRSSDLESTLAIARFAFDRPVPSSEWVTVSSGGNDDKPRWSADGRTLYFISERDGFRCIWGRRVDSQALKPVGDAFAVHHFHRARRSIKDLPLNAFSTWIAGHELFFIQAEQTANLWLMEPSARPQR